MAIPDYSAEARRKALAGQKLADPSNKKNAEIYNRVRSQMGGLTTDRYAGEAVRKANAGVALTDPSNKTNVNVYNKAKETGSNNVADVVKALNTSKEKIETRVGASANTNGGTGVGNNQDQMVKNIYDQQRAALMAQLKASRDKAVGQINQQKEELAPQYQGLRNQSDVVNNQNVNKLREIMAANGLASGDRAMGGSGENISGQVALGAARQNSLNRLNTQEQQQVNDFDRRISDLNNPESQNALMANLGAEQARSTLDQFNTNRQFGLQEGSLMGQYNGQQTLAALNAARQHALGEGGLTGQYNGAPTLAAQGQAFNQNMAQDQFAYKQTRDQIKDQRYQQQFDEDVRRHGMDYALKQQVQAGRLSMQQAQLALQQSKFGYQQQQDATLNEQWQQEFDASQNQPGSTPLASDLYGDINKRFLVDETTQNVYGDPVKTGNKVVSNPEQLEAYILSQGLSDAEAEKLYRYYGLDMGD